MLFLSALTDAARTRWARIEAALRAHPLLWALVLSMVIAALFVLTLNPGYGTNDDVGMQSAVDGSMGEPSPHLVFSNVLIGLLLSTLYRAADSFPWYGLYLYLAHFASLLAVVYVVLAVRRSRLWVRLASLAAVLAVFHLPMWMQLQFTSTAILLGASGVMLFFAVAEAHPTPWGAIVAGGAMVGFSSWIRWHSAWVVILLALPALALAFRHIPWRHLTVFASVAATTILAGSVAQAVYYAGQPDWQAYFEFNATRGILHQSSDLTALDPAVLAAVGWSKNDLAMFRRWFYTDAQVHQAGDLEVIAATLPSSFRARDGWTALADQGEGWRGALRLTVVASLAAFAWVEGSRRARALVLASVAAFAAIAFVVAGEAKLPERVAAPMLAFLPLVFLAAPQMGERGGLPGTGSAGGIWKTGLALVSAAALVGGAVNAHALDQDNTSRDANRRNILTGLQAVDPDALFVSWGGQLPLGTGSVSPWEASPDGSDLLPLGWQQRSPLHRALLARHGIDDLFAAIANRGDIYLPLRSPELRQRYLLYLRQHYGFAGLLRPVARVGTLSVYNLAVDYRVDDQAGALIEHHLDGSFISYPLDSPGIAHQAVAVRPQDGGLTVAGRAAADLVVVTSRGKAIALVLPEGNGAFSAKLARSRTNLRLFALSAGRAAEVTLRSVSLP
jgi:hypothetical protein